MITITFLDDERGLTKSFQVERIEHLLDSDRLSKAQKSRAVRLPVVWMVLEVAKQMDKKDEQNKLDNHIDI